MALCYVKQIQQRLNLDPEKFNIVEGLTQSLKDNIQAHCQVPDTQTILCNLQYYLNTEFGKTFQKQEIRLLYFSYIKYFLEQIKNMPELLLEQNGYTLADSYSQQDLKLFSLNTSYAELISQDAFDPITNTVFLPVCYRNI